MIDIYEKENLEGSLTVSAHWTKVSFVDSWNQTILTTDADVPRVDQPEDEIYIPLGIIMISSKKRLDKRQILQLCRNHKWTYNLI